MTSFDDHITAKFADVVRTENDLHDYQRDAVEFAYNNPFCALFIDLGLGKTIISLTLLNKLIVEGLQFNKALIIAPLRVATMTWPNEIPQWSHTAKFNYSVCCGNEKDRIAAVESNASIHIINRENIEWLVNYIKSTRGRKWPYDTVIIDESSSLKDYKTRRFKALKKVRPQIKRMLQLTATPAAETYLHLFAQIYLLDSGERFGKFPGKFQKEYFDTDQYTYEVKLKPGAADEIIEKISDICMVMKSEDYLDLQEPVFVEQVVHLNDKELALYKQMEEDFVITLPDGTEIEADTAAALSQKLAAMASGFVYNTNWLTVGDESDDLKPVRSTHHIHDHKLEKLSQLVEEACDEPLMVVYWHKASLERLKKVFPHAEVMGKSGETLRRWNKKEIPMLLVHPASAGHGLNLQYGGNQIVFYDLPWSLELYLQTIGRLARQGQTKAVVVHHIISSGTIDEYVVAALRRKEDAQLLLFRKLKELREKLTRS